MKQKGLSAEILCLIFIISITVLFGKILTDVKNIISIKINQIIPQPTTPVDYDAYSYRIEDVYEKLKEVNIIRNVDELKKFKEYLADEDISIDWIDEKLEKYNKDEFKNKTVVVLAIVNNNNVTITRINGVSKKNNDLTIGISKNYKNVKVNSQYTWIAVLEISDSNSQILLNSY